MVDSKYTHMRVNNEIELCEIYEREIKDKVEKAFVRNGVSFFIKWKRERSGPKENSKYLIFVNQHQRQKAEAVIHAVLEDANDNVMFTDGKTKKGWGIKKIYHNSMALLSKM